MQKQPIQVDIKSFMSALGCSFDEFSKYTGISIEELNEINSASNSFTLSKFNDICGILSRIQFWFDSDSEGWAWFTSQRLLGFGNMTASEIVKLHHSDGVKAVNDYITSKDAGGFE